MSFLALPVTVDPDQLATDAIAYLQSAIPGFVPADGHLESWLIEALARMTSEAAQVAADVGDGVFSAFGARFFGITPEPGQPATLTSTWTVLTADGWVIPAGTTVAYRTSGDTATLLRTTTTVTIPAGQTTATGVLLTATTEGTAGNGVPSGSPLEMVDSLAYVTGVTSTSTSAGGSDPESDAQFRDRLAAEMRLLSPRPILPSDFAVLASRVPGVARALGISGYNPDNSTSGNERYVAVAVVDEAGAAASPAVRAAVVAYLDALREVNFVVKAMAPTYTEVDVTYQIRVRTGYVGADVVAAVDAALAEALSPAVWAGGNASPPVWDAGQTVVRLLQTATLIATVEGVDFVSSLLLNGAAADVTLTGVAPLPQPGAIAGTTV